MKMPAQFKGSGPRTVGWTVSSRAASLAAGCLLGVASAAADDLQIDAMGIEVSAEQNRAVSFTNKRSAYYYTQTHHNDHPEHAWFRGFNLAKQRVFSGYQLSSKGAVLDPRKATVTVYPDRMKREYQDGKIEELRLFDHQDLVAVSLSGASGRIGLRLLGEQIAPGGSSASAVLYRSAEAPGLVIGVAGIGMAEIALQGGESVTSADAGGFLITVAETPEAVDALIQSARADGAGWQQQRRRRMEDLLGRVSRSGDERLDRALSWITQTLDQLVTRQQGDGIYAGLPWFNEYWGRDSFIAMPGAVLVNGRFEIARKILISFAKFQDLDPDSRFFGRMPNIINPQGIDYHTTDGTPRFVIQLRQYLAYSGDLGLARQLYPNVRASIEGSLKNWIDSNGYLQHAHNETWMDARRAEDQVPFSPRGTRANDIQALWVAQLEAGAEIAEWLEDGNSAQRWRGAAKRVRDRFPEDFLPSLESSLADRLDADGQPDHRIRPNQLFALDLIADQEVRDRITRRAWQELVYPWGVASVGQDDPFFHPYHRADQWWHKDEAYHNGAVWQWLNGIAMQRLIEAGGRELAFRLIQAMNDDALERGVVGGLAENRDAYPHQDETLPRLTGTYLQAWSNAEHLRVWSQYFLGIRPDVMNRVLTVAPRLPRSLDRLETRARIGSGWLRYDFRRQGDEERHAYEFDELSIQVHFDLPPLEDRLIGVGPGQRLIYTVGPEGLRIVWRSREGEIRDSGWLEPKAERAAAVAAQQQALDGLAFARPRPLVDHPVIDQRHTGEDLCARFTCAPGPEQD